MLFQSAGSREPDQGTKKVLVSQYGFNPQARESLIQKYLQFFYCQFLFQSAGSREPDRQMQLRGPMAYRFNPQARESLIL